MLSDILNALLLHEVDGGTKTKYIAHRGGASLEAEGEFVVGGTLEGDSLYHLTTTLIGRKLVKYLFAAVHYSYAHRGVHFVAGEAIEVAAYLLHIDRHVGNGLCAIDKHGDTMEVRNFGDLLDGIDSAQSVGHMIASHDAGMGGEKLAISLKVEDSLVAERDDPQGGSRTLAGQLPGYYVGVMLHARHYHLVAVPKEALAKRGGYQIDALGGATGKDNFAALAGINKLAYLAAYSLVLLGGLLGQIVCATVNIAVQGEVIIGESVDYLPWLLSGGSVVEIDQWVAVGSGIEYGEIHVIIVFRGVGIIITFLF